MVAGDKVRIRTPVLNGEAGLTGTVKAVGLHLVVVEFEDGRQGHYRPYKLQPAEELG